jgi:hypothetical protein
MSINLTPLTHRVAITVPSTVNVTDAAPTLQAQWVDTILTTLSTLFGGATALPGIGAWVSPTAGLVKENIVNVFAFCSEEGLTKARPAVMKLAMDLCVAMRQEAVAVDLDGKLYFVEAANAAALAAAA